MSTTVPPGWGTALVTGASDGIGLAVARELAARGVPRLVLVARRRGALEALAGELSTAHGTEVEVLAADLSVAESRRLVEARLVDRGAPPVDLLVNNAGVGSWGPFVDAAVDEQEALVALDVVAVVRLTRFALPGMVARGRGTVVLVSSLAGEQAGPGHATYAASKAFVTRFGESLVEELVGTGVTVTVVLPGYTRSGFQARSGSAAEAASVPSWAWRSSGAVAADLVDAAAAGRARCVPGLGYRVVAGVASVVPTSWRGRLVGRISRRRAGGS